MPITIETIQNLGKIFEKGLEDEYLSRSLWKIIKHEKERTSQDIQSLRKDLDKFESEYKMSSDDFINRFEKGKMGDEEDYFEWAAIFKMYKRSMERFEMLEGLS
ncbi:MAG: hypothetical protein ACE5HY_05185 [Candidatus Hydrothermarchaeales archaeon]